MSKIVQKYRDNKCKFFTLTLSSFFLISVLKKMQGIKRVIIFCLLTTILPIFLLVLPLYLRHNLYADVVYAVTESDVLEISDGVSTIFCSVKLLFFSL